MDVNGLQFNAEIKSIFDEFRDLMNKLEVKVRQREQQLKREVKAQLLSSLESLYKGHFSATVDGYGEENVAFLGVLIAKLNSEEFGCQRENLKYDTSAVHVESNSLSDKFGDYKKRVETTSPFSPNSITTTDSTDDTYSRCQSPEVPDKGEEVTKMIVPLNPTQFINESWKSEGDVSDSEEAGKSIVPQTYYRQAVKKRRLCEFPLSIVNTSNQCPICLHNFSQRNSLNRHIRSHTGERPFPCSYCGKRFIDKERLKVHIRIHTGEKPFSCDVCGRNFTQKSTVKRHMSVHTGAKPYSCEHCGKRFGSKDNLKVHIKSHIQATSNETGELTSAGDSQSYPV